MKMAAERYIAGIYNYCDYWCERCPFTRRCRNFVSGRAEQRQFRSGDVGSLPDADATNAAFWDTLAEQIREVSIFGKSEPEMHDIAASGRDAADGPDDPGLAREETRRKEQLCHPLVLLSRDYMRQVHQWLKAADGDMKAVARSLLEDAGNRFVTDDVEENAREIGEMIEVVAWYHTLIPAKLGRAVNGLLERDGDEGAVPVIIAQSRHSDANGSGKIALVGIERSIAAWLKLRAILPAKEDMILAMCSLLDRMRRRIRIDLPDSVTFRRPGFDGEDVGLFD
ncbi:MAG: hypothetical protein A2340_09775 [Lentisphaerae bacterium RIFOXYB12_FULL_60_10]|nr:MAG: hypothetical protein A2340_09775 [Lentisphaerae bacterium RIFOXYB12_FULL_60_10]